MRSRLCQIGAWAAASAALSFAVAPRPAAAQINGTYVDGQGQQATVMSGGTVYINPCQTIEPGTNIGQGCSWPVQSGAFPMPAMTFWIANGSASDNVTWSLEINWTDRHGYVNGYLSQSISRPGVPANQTWSPNWAWGSVGGSAEVTANVYSCNTKIAQYTLQFFVWGANPYENTGDIYDGSSQNKPLIDGELASLGSVPWYTSQILVEESDHLAWQFFTTGRPRWYSIDGNGIMQVDRYFHPEDYGTNQQAYWDFITNMQDGYTILQQAKSWAQTYWAKQLEAMCAHFGESLSGTSCSGGEIKAATSEFTCAHGPDGASEPFHYPQTAGTINMLDGLAIQYYNGGAFIRWGGSDWQYYIRPADRNYVPAVCKIPAF